jgi:hypothetical protein
MKRSHFLTGVAAGALAGHATAALADDPAFIRADPLRVGARLSLAEMLAFYPPAAAGDLVQYELGFGATYDKQIGFGREADRDADRAFVETQVGNGDHACNPNTLKKVYLKGHAFADIFTPYAVGTYVTRSGNMLTRWGDGIGPAAQDLLLLDTKTLYDPRRATITAVSAATVTIGGTPIAATHVRATYPSATGAQLHSAELWLSPAVPLGLVEMKATAPDIDDFHLSVYRFTRHFKTELAMTLTTIRALTPTGDVPVIQ